MKRLITQTVIASALFLAALPHTTFAQQATTDNPNKTTATAPTGTYTLRGRVVDAATGTPLPGAFVVVQGTSKQTAADEKGNFILRTVPRAGKEIELSYMGYKTLVQPVSTGYATVNMGDVKLTEDAISVNEVVVQGTPPIAVQLGDTTQYNAGAFKTNPDATAEDLLKKMPGFTVQDGKVETQGESVARVYVDGKRFFDDDPMAALKTLPSDVVESIQLFDEKSEESKFTGFDDGNTTKTLNIVTTRKAKTSSFGRLVTGYGTDNRYMLAGNASVFTDNHRWTVSAGSNNVNQLGFSMSDLSGSSSGGGGGGRGMGNSSGIQTTNVLGLNYSGQLGAKKKTELAANYFFYSSDNERNRLTQQNYFASEKFDSRFYQKGDSTISKSNTHRLNIKMETDFNDNNKVIFTPRATLQFNDNTSHSLATNQLNGAITDRAVNSNTSKLNAYNLGGELIWMHKFAKEGRTLTASGQLTMNDRNNDQYLLGDTRFYEADAFRDTIQNQYTTNINNTNNARFRLSFTEPLTKYARLVFNYTGRYNWSNSDKKTLLFNPETGRYEDIDLTLSNNFKRDYVTNGGGLGYVYRKNEYTVNLGADYEYSKMFNDQTYPQQVKSNYGFHSVNPSARFVYSIAKTKNLYVTYRGNSELPSVSQLQNVIDNSNPLQVTMGNPNLKQGYQNNFSLRYSTTNIQKSTTFNLMLSFSNQSNYITNERTFLNRDTTIMGAFIPKGAQVSAPINLNGYWSMRTGASYSFAIKPLKTNINTNLNYSYSRMPSKYDGLLSYTNNNQASFRLGIASNISENIDFNISSRTSYTYATSSKQTNKYLNEQVGVNFNWIFLNGFVLNTDYNMSFYYYPSSTTETQRYNMLNLGLGRKFLSKKQAEIRLTAYDLLNQSKSINHSVNDNFVEDTISNVLQRYFMLTFTYRFNTMKGKAAAPATPERRGMQRPGGYDGGYGGGALRMGH